MKVKVEGTYLTPDQRKQFYKKDYFGKRKTGSAKSSFSAILNKVLGKTSNR